MNSTNEFCARVYCSGALPVAPQLLGRRRCIGGIVIGGQHHVLAQQIQPVVDLLRNDAQLLCQLLEDSGRVAVGLVTAAAGSCCGVGDDALRLIAGGLYRGLPADNLGRPPTRLLKNMSGLWLGGFLDAWPHFQRSLTFDDRAGHVDAHGFHQLRHFLVVHHAQMRKRHFAAGPQTGVKLIDDL